jgi:hypothetical protein
MFIFSFSEGTNMNEIVEYLDHVGHKLGIGGFEGVIGAVVLLLAAFVILLLLFSHLRRGGMPENQSNEGYVNPLEWMDDVEKTLKCDIKSQVESPALDRLHIWHKKS